MNKKISHAVYDEKDFYPYLMRMNVLKGTGVDTDECKVKPIIAVVNSHTEMNTGHMHLSSLAVRVKEGIHAGGGIPFEFNVPAPCDGLAEGNDGMKFILAQRDLIADMVETHVRSQLFDGMVMIASCDKIIPGMLMAAARLDLPTIFLTGGPTLYEIRLHHTYKGTILHSDYDDLNDKLKTVYCASCGACEIMGTANTFQSLAEALGMVLPGTANIPAYHSEKLRVARRTGKRIMEMVEENLTADKILTKKAIENALSVDMAIGGSTNVALHLPALAHELGIDLPLTVFNDFNRKIPTLCRLSPSGPHGVTDLYQAGGIPALMKRLKDDLHLDALSVSGQTIGDIVENARVMDEQVIPDKTNPYYPEGSTVVITGNLAPEGAVIKQSAVVKDQHVFTGPARVFESEHDFLAAIREKKINEGEVIVIRNEGPKGGPGMPEMLAATMSIGAHGYSRVALITDGRFSGATSGPCVGHVSPEAFDGGPIGVLKDGDEITIDIPQRKLDVKLSKSEIQNRLASYRPIKRDIPKGFMQRYVKLVSSAAKGAILA
jgi:dihydroxy-acid dehydratase